MRLECLGALPASPPGCRVFSSPHSSASVCGADEIWDACEDELCLVAPLSPAAPACACPRSHPYTMSRRTHAPPQEGKTVVWRTAYGHRVKKSFTFPAVVTQAIWCRFPSLGPEGAAHLCVLVGQELVSVFTPSGSTFEVKLPCKISRMWELPAGQGLLLARATASGALGGDGAAESSGVEALAAFTLQHPLEELKPLARIQPVEQSPGGGPPAGATTALLCDLSERVVAVCAELSVVVTYHLRRRRHCFWQWCRAPGASASASDGSSAPPAPPVESEAGGAQRPPMPPMPPPGQATGVADEALQADVRDQSLPIAPQWALRPLREDPVGSAPLPATTVFVADDQAGSAVLAVLDSKGLQLLRVRPRGAGSEGSSAWNQLETVARVAATGAVPVWWHRCIRGSARSLGEEQQLQQQVDFIDILYEIQAVHGAVFAAAVVPCGAAG